MTMILLRYRETQHYNMMFNNFLLFLHNLTVLLLNVLNFTGMFVLNKHTNNFPTF